MTDFRNLSDDENDVEGSRVEDVGDTTEYVVDRPLDHEHREGNLFFRLRWYACPSEENTWEP